MKLIKTVKEARKAKWYTQQELSQIIGVKQPYYSRIERGLVHPGSELVDKMIDALDIKVILQ